MDVHTQETTPRMTYASQPINPVRAFLCHHKADSQPRLARLLYFRIISSSPLPLHNPTLIHYKHLPQPAIEEGKGREGTIQLQRVSPGKQVLNVPLHLPLLDLVNTRTTHLPGRLLLIC